MTSPDLLQYTAVAVMVGVPVALAAMWLDACIENADEYNDEHDL